MVRSVVPAVVLVAVLLATGCAGPSDARAGASPRPAAPSAPAGTSAPIQVSTSHCGEGWIRPRAGDQTLSLSNTGNVPAEAYIVGVPDGAVHAELEELAPGVTRTLRVSLGAGTYAVRCLADGSDPVDGPRVRITGTATGAGPAVVPVTDNDLYAPAKKYAAYVTRGLKTLAKRTATLRDAVDRGDLAAARAAWLPAHLAYERLGAAYGTFGDLGDAIDGRPAGLPGGVRDKDFTGFHRLEHGLWHGESATSLRGPADRLDRDVRALRRDFPDERLDPADLPLRAHEIMEDALEFELTGRADEGSGTTLATVSANLEGTREAVDVLRPLLRSRYPDLPEADRLLARVRDQVEAQRHGDRWTSVADLDRRAREALNGSVGELLERLAPIAVVGFPRRTS
ncbi:EfeM/EfeO family lipoprotein [Microbispora sp. RL4-1S]|uniref:EfeM/EfeO family lipoprotein n=1 Tax=Microbispora oryzae TaxID=2806554 RepID=A0A941AIE0_9ACTN|nr:EfeM/EfeO family lipoprotein [Microbispora oryzae]MBP2705100.1 EfeM/EfeO family lipoprotein [Microbispora oryzae]